MQSTLKKLSKSLFLLWMTSLLVLSVAAAGYTWPTPSVTNLTQGFSGSHVGVDIATPVGTQVVSIKSGTVAAVYTGCNNYSRNLGTCVNGGGCHPSFNYNGSSGYCNDGFGNGLIIHHTDGTWASYAHMSTIDSQISKGSTVAAGTVLGETGSSGNSSGPHLHFEMRGNQSSTSYWSCTPINPITAYDDTVATPTAPSTSGVSFSKPTDPAYQNKYFVTDTNAQLVLQFKKPTGSNITTSGIRLYRDGDQIMEKNFSVSNVGLNTTSFHSWYDLNSECNTTLTPGTTYQYTFTATVDGAFYESDQYSFTTTGAAPSAPGVTFSKPTDPTYQNKYFVTDTNAQLVVQINKPSGSNITSSGIRIYRDGAQVMEQNFSVSNVGTNTTTFHSWYDLNNECNATLTPGTTYQYTFIVTVDGKLYESEKDSFTTTGTAPITSYTIQLNRYLRETHGDTYVDTATDQTTKLPYSMIIPIIDGTTRCDFRCNANFAMEGDSVTLTKCDESTIQIDAYYRAVEIPKEEPDVPVIEKEEDIPSLEITKPTSALPFEKIRKYHKEQFKDVLSSDWCYDNVKTAYRLGLFNGNSDGYFAPNSNISVSETITIASRIHNIYHENEETFQRLSTDTTWYAPYVRYATSHDINILNHYDAAITREDFVYIMSSALPSMEFSSKGLNLQFHDQNSIYHEYEVELLSEAGVISGYVDGTFGPNQSITRAEAATIVSRMVTPNNRLS